MLADVHDTNVAAEIRAAVELYIRDLTSRPDFEQRLAEAERKRRALVEQVLASTRSQ
jgi:hypothetical protein